MATATVERDYIRISETARADARRIDRLRPLRQRRLQHQLDALLRRLPALQAAAAATGDRDALTALERDWIALQDRLGDLEDGSCCRRDARGAIREHLAGHEGDRLRLEASLRQRSRSWGDLERCERDLEMVAHPDRLTGLSPADLERALAAAGRARGEVDGHRDKAVADGRAKAEELLRTGADRDLVGALNGAGLVALSRGLCALLGEHGARVAFLIDELTYPNEEP